MTDKDLAAYGERLWTAIIATELAPIEVGGLTAALRARTPWAEMGPGLKLALFRIARNSEPTAAPVAAADAPREARAEESETEDGPPLDESVSTESPPVAEVVDEKVAVASEPAPESAPNEGKG